MKVLGLDLDNSPHIAQDKSLRYAKNITIDNKGQSYFNERGFDFIGELDDILENMGMIVEGVSTTKAAYELSRELNIDMPITETIYKVLYENAKVEDVIRRIMLRDFKSEQEF